MKADLTLSWSNGQTEGQVNRVKLQMWDGLVVKRHVKAMSPTARTAPFVLCSVGGGLERMRVFGARP
ncbi:MAG: hypothetical protein M3Q29_11600, partial [Chloroflexota bacterium]|nr:hypothetical protein [Chloroflexota bacterium]